MKHGSILFKKMKDRLLDSSLILLLRYVINTKRAYELVDIRASLLERNLSFCAKCYGENYLAEVIPAPEFVALHS